MGFNLGGEGVAEGGSEREKRGGQRVGGGKEGRERGKGGRGGREKKDGRERDDNV